VCIRGGQGGGGHACKLRPACAHAWLAIWAAGTTGQGGERHDLPFAQIMHAFIPPRPLMHMQAAAQREGLSYDEIQQHAERMNALDPSEVIPKAAPAEGVCVAWVVGGCSPMCVGVGVRKGAVCRGEWWVLMLTITLSPSNVLLVRRGGAPAGRLGKHAGSRVGQALLLAQEDPEDSVGAPHCRHADQLRGTRRRRTRRRRASVW
jgi:hypothetical protein